MTIMQLYIVLTVTNDTTIKLTYNKVITGELNSIIIHYFSLFGGRGGALGWGGASEV